MLKHYAKINDGYKFLDSYREHQPCLAGRQARMPCLRQAGIFNQIPIAIGTIACPGFSRDGR